MNYRTENYFEAKNNLPDYNRFMLDRFKTYVASLFTAFENVCAFCEFRF